MDVYQSRLAEIGRHLTPLEQVGKQKVTWIGAVLLLIGLFVPAKSYSFSSSIINYSSSQSLWDYGTFWAIVLLLLALASAALAYIRDYRWLAITGGAAVLICILNFLYAFSSPGFGVSARPSWGWILLFLGSLLILAAAALQPDPAEPQGDAMVTINELRARFNTPK